MSLRVTNEDYKVLLGKTGKVSETVSPSPSPTRNKYKAVRKEVGGHTFHSTGEAKRYCQLYYEQSLGVISELQIQVPFMLAVSEIYITSLVLDFVYVRNGQLILEDFKGVLTETYRIKKALLFAIYGLTITETFASR